MPLRDDRAPAGGHLPIRSRASPGLKNRLTGADGAGVEGLGNISARIAQINQQITALSPKPAATRGTGTTSGTTAAGQTFATELAGAMRSASTTGTTGVKLTKDGVPADLVQYGNGRIPANALETIGRGGHRLWSPAADASRP